MEATKRPEFSDDPLGLIDDAELKSVRDYLLSAQRHKLSWKEEACPLRGCMIAYLHEH